MTALQQIQHDERLGYLQGVLVEQPELQDYTPKGLEHFAEYVLEGQGEGRAHLLHLESRTLVFPAGGRKAFAGVGILR